MSLLDKMKKQQQSGNRRSEEPPQEDDREPCPFCGRKYSRLASHIQNCKDNPNKPKKTSNIGYMEPIQINSDELWGKIIKRRGLLRNYLLRSQSPNTTKTCPRQAALDQIIVSVNEILLEKCREWMRKQSSV